MVKKSEVVFPNNAKDAGVLLLTKPLGHLLIESDNKWQKAKEFVTKENLWDSLEVVEKSMSRLNLNGAKIIKKYRVGCCTDVTGFGIRDHAENLLAAQKKDLKFVINRLPIIKLMDIINDRILNFKLKQGFSAETSGGLLIRIDKNDAENYMRDMHSLNEWCWII